MIDVNGFVQNTEKIVGIIIGFSPWLHRAAKGTCHPMIHPSGKRISVNSRHGLHIARVQCQRTTLWTGVVDRRLTVVRRQVGASRVQQGAVTTSWTCQCARASVGPHEGQANESVG